MSDCLAPVIVLTGGIASGKSTVARMLIDQGAELISADMLAREVMSPGTPVWEKIVQTFGPSVKTSTGELSRKKLAALIFADHKARHTLEKITHPAIWALLDQRLKAARKTASAVAVEIPLYFEGNRRLAEATEVWVVYVDEKIQLQRLMEREQLTEDEASARVKAQLPLSFKCSRADRVIDNRGTKEETLFQVKAALAALTAAGKIQRFGYDI